jgi:hypothetical protein
MMPKFQILLAVVIPLAILVVNGFLIGQRTPKGVGHHLAMFENHLALDLDQDITRRSPVPAKAFSIDPADKGIAVLPPSLIMLSAHPVAEVITLEGATVDGALSQDRPQAPVPTISLTYKFDVFMASPARIVENAKATTKAFPAAVRNRASHAPEYSILGAEERGPE